jgi:ATP-binding protein involved in chromosome partitioning
MSSSMKTYYDIVGDGGSDILGQVEEKRSRITASLAGVRHRIAIASGKGGVGKSTLSRYLASAMVSHGWQVGILDADLNGPTQARLGGIGETPPVPGSRGLLLPRSSDGVSVLSLGSYVPESSAVEFESVTSGESHTWRATREFTTMSEILAGVDWGELDALVFDLPPGAERTVQFAEFLGPEVDFVLITLPSALASGVVARSATALASAPNRILGHVLNMDGYACAGCGDVRPLFVSEDAPTLDTECLASIPFDPGLAALSDRGGSLSEMPESAAAQAIDSLACRLMNLLESA